MDELPKERKIYCDQVDELVDCVLVRHERAKGRRHNAYRCVRIGTSEDPPCNPCSHYCEGKFIPLPENIDKLSPDEREEAANRYIQETVEVPASRLRRLIEIECGMIILH